MEVLSENINCPVVRVPGRKFPGVVIQGDSLRILFDHAEEIEQFVVHNRNEEMGAAAAHLKSILSGYIEEYERTMAAHGHELPYSKSN